MEIISIPLKGALLHKDTEGNSMVVREDEVQVMSAGRGVYHSEYNNSDDECANYLQIWVFPNVSDIKPRYGKITLDKSKMENQFHPFLSPERNNGNVWIHQDACFYISDMHENHENEYRVRKEGNGIYIFVIEGKLRIGDKEIQDKDGLGIWEVDKISIKAQSNCRILLMDIPMQLET
jgi:redox-sensitive bicupin YhaK (pirin superfamily)